MTVDLGFGGQPVRFASLEIPYRAGEVQAGIVPLEAIRPTEGRISDEVRGFWEEGGGSTLSVDGKRGLGIVIS